MLGKMAAQIKLKRMSDEVKAPFRVLLAEAGPEKLIGRSCEGSSTYGTGSGKALTGYSTFNGFVQIDMINAVIGHSASLNPDKALSVLNGSTPSSPTSFPQ